MLFVNYRIFLVSIMILTVAGIVDAEPPIEVIYWKSSDVQSPSQGDIDSIHEVMIKVQYFFASEMDRYGYGKKTFNFNKDITVVEGKKRLDEYTDVWSIQNEYPAIKYGLDNAIYVVFVGGSESFGGGGIAVSQQLCANIPEQHKFCNNMAVIPADNKRLIEVLTAHEIGHAFSLDHPSARLVKNKVDIMFFPLHVVPGAAEYLSNYALNPNDSKFLNEDDRLYIQTDTQYMNENMYIDNPDLVAYYPFDGNSKDSSENRNDGRVKDKARYNEGVFIKGSYTEGKFGDAIELKNGVCVEINISDSLHGDFFKSEPFTLSLWVYAKSSAHWGHLWRSRAGSYTGETLFISDNMGMVSWRGNISGQWNILCETNRGIFREENWVHIAVTSDRHKFRLYVDGDQTAEISFQETAGGNIRHWIGGYFYNEKFDGLIDDYAIFSRALTEDEISEVMESGIAEFLQTGQSIPIEETTEDPYSPEDVNKDGVVDLEDIKIVRMGMQTPTTYDTDVNDDGITDESDVAIVKLKAIEAIMAAAPRKPRNGKIKWTSWGSIKSAK